MGGYKARLPCPASRVDPPNPKTRVPTARAAWPPLSPAPWPSPRLPSSAYFEAADFELAFVVAPALIPGGMRTTVFLAERFLRAVALPTAFFEAVST